MKLQISILGCLLVVSQLVEVADSRRPRFKEWQVRLVGGHGDYEGSVLVFRNNRWGSICDDDWDLNDADVVCKQLGYEGAKEAVTSSKFGRARRRIWLSNLDCSGEETSLEQCAFLDGGQINRKCRRQDRSAGVVCQVKVDPKEDSTQRTTFVSPKSTRTRITSTDAPATEQPPEATTTSRRHPSTTTATTTSTRRASTASPTATTESDTKEQWEENEESVPQDTQNEKESVLDVMTDKTDDEYMLQGDDPNTFVKRTLEVRIAGGRYPWEGRLEVREGPDEEWGVICSEDWTLREARVACRQLTGDFGKQALRANYFGGEDQNKIFRRISCTGRETHLDQCVKIRSDHALSCPKRILVAGVVCSSELPDLQPDLEILRQSILLQDRHLYYLLCSMEENCLSSSAYVIRNTSDSWRSASRRLLKFSSVVHNVGTADFRPFLSKTQWQWHSCHQHYHSMEVFAHYDLIDSNGNGLAEGNKASFCLEDSTCRPGIAPKYNCKGFRDQGLSVNCSDDYLNDIDCQWIDITDIKPGEYTFKLAVNPSLLVSEISYDNNVAACDLWYSGYNARLTNCRYESLLPDEAP